MKFRFRGKGPINQNLPAFGERVDASFVAFLSGRTRQHITRLCRKGALPGAYQSKGGHWRFKWSKPLFEWINENWNTELMSQEMATKRYVGLFPEWNACMNIQRLLRRRLNVIHQIQRRALPRANLEIAGKALFENVGFD